MREVEMIFIPFDLGNKNRDQRHALDCIKLYAEASIGESKTKSGEGYDAEWYHLLQYIRKAEILSLDLTILPEDIAADQANIEGVKIPNIYTTASLFVSIREQLGRILASKRDQFIVIISGDHTVAGVSLPVLKERYGQFKVLWIDAHPDILTPATTTSGQLHGMSVSVAIGAKIPPDHYAYECWEEMLPNVPISLEDFSYLGIRDIEKNEAEVLAAERIRRIDSNCNLRDHVSDFVENSRYFVQFDLDSIDSSELGSGVATPVQNGLSIKCSIDLLTRAASDPNCIGIEFVEYSPKYDKDKKTVSIYARILSQVIAAIK